MIHLTNFQRQTICGIDKDDLQGNEIMTSNIFAVTCEHCIKRISRELEHEINFDLDVLK
jgi:hypothetical protein